MGKVVQSTWKFFIGYLRELYPAGVCMIGALFFIVAGEHRWLGGIVAASSFFWALDLARSQAKAATESDIAGRLIGALTNGKNTQIDVTLHRSALSEDKEQG